MDPKPRPNQDRYLEVLRRMTPQQRLMKAFELSDLARALFKAGLRHRHPDLPEAELHDLYLEHLARCRNPHY